METYTYTLTLDEVHAILDALSLYEPANPFTDQVRNMIATQPADEVQL